MYSNDGFIYTVYLNRATEVCHMRAQGRINHSGALYQRKAGALFSYAKRVVHFFLQKVDDLF